MHQFGKTKQDLYIATSDNLVWASMQSTNYVKYLEAG
jgi:hypothetical protein